jgi:DNA-directed RNA polymerase II subunit RPB1
MVTDIVPISPPYIRPSVKFDNNQRSEDDITYKYLDIIKADQTLRAKIKSGADAEIIHDWWMLLQYHFATLIDNDLPDAPASVHRLGRPLKSIVQRIVGKEGRIRGNLMGKRVDFSARTVITGDPNLSVRQVGVPLKIAMNLTVPEMVTERNRVFLQKCVENGPDTYPGVKSIQLARDGNTYSLKVLSRRRIEISIGDIVHRHMTDGDPVLFNRQPSLHRPSMMCHRAKILPYNTFRLNVMDTPPYNADFDGDEMNMHLPQSLEAMAELRMLAAVPNQIVIAKNNSPVVTAVQDIVLGINRMTMNTLVASKPEDAANPHKIHIRDRDAMNIMMGIRGFRGALPKPTVKDGDSAFWSGKDLFHAILPGVFINQKTGDSRTVITPDSYSNRDGADAPIDKSSRICSSPLIVQKWTSMSSATIAAMNFGCANKIGP